MSPTRSLSLALLLVVGSFATCGATRPSEDAGAQLSFGIGMAKRGLWSEALFRFETARRLQPDNPRVLNNLAVAYEAVGKFEEALEAYRAALKIDPGSRQAKQNYARFVEFYQSFRPAAAKSAASAGTAAPAASSTAAPAAPASPATPAPAAPTPVPTPAPGA